MKKVLGMVGALSCIQAQAADSGIRFTVEPMPPVYSGQASAPQMYMPAATALHQMQHLHLDQQTTGQTGHESTTDTKPGHRRQRSLSENDANQQASITVQIQQLPSLSQAPMQKLLAASLGLQKIVQDLVEAHHKSLQELESTPGTNTQVRQVAEKQLPKARERVDDSTKAIDAAIRALTERMAKAKK